MIEIRNLNKKYDDIEIFKDFNLTINDGEFVIFCGESGCGKTTLLSIIGAIEPADSGEIIVNGIDITKKKNVRKYLQEQVGFLFQNFALVDNKTVKQNLDMVSDDLRDNITLEDALNYVGLSDKKDTKVYKLSGGEQQRVALARLMLKKCSVILADEPTGSLDKKNADAVLELLMKLNKRGKTVIMVTHVEEYKNIGDRLVELKRNLFQ